MFEWLKQVGPSHVHPGSIDALELWISQWFVSNSGSLKDMTVKYDDIEHVPVMIDGRDSITKVFTDTILKIEEYTDLYGTIEAGTMLEAVAELDNDGAVGQA